MAVGDVPASVPAAPDIEAYRAYLNSWNGSGGLDVEGSVRSRSSTPGASNQNQERREYARVRAPLAQIAVPPPPPWTDIGTIGAPTNAYNFTNASAAQQTGVVPGAYPSWADDVVGASTGTVGEPKPEDELDATGAAAGAKYVLRCGAATGELVAIDSDSDSDSGMDGSSDVDTDSEMSSGEDAEPSSYTPSLLPVWPSSSSSSSSCSSTSSSNSRRQHGRRHGHQRRGPRRMVRQSTGCGALVHCTAAPRVGGSHATWSAKGSAACSVVHLDRQFFEKGRGGQVKQFACGCRWYGVGCSEWCVFIFVSETNCFKLRLFY